MISAHVAHFKGSMYMFTVTASIQTYGNYIPGTKHPWHAAQNCELCLSADGRLPEILRYMYLLDNVSHDCCLAVELDVDQFQLIALPSHFKVGSVVKKTEWGGRSKDAFTKLETCQLGSYVHVYI